MKNGVPLLRVLIVDDEPYIRKGLKALIDWEAEGYYIAGEASDGKNAIQLLKQNEYDLIITDIMMPDMDGMELIHYVNNHKLSTARFVLLSGFYDFQYAKAAIQCGCCDYILKPIQKDELLTTIRKIVEEFHRNAGIEKMTKAYEKAYLDRHLLAIIWGKYDCINLSYVQERILHTNGIAYIHCELSLNDERFVILSEDSRRAQQRKLYNYTTLLLKDYSNHIVFNIMKHTECYDIGIIYCSNMANETGLTQQEWLNRLVKELSERVGYEVIACMGNMVQSFRLLSESFREALMIRSFRFYKKNEGRTSRFCKRDSDVQVVQSASFKKQLDELLHVIEINDKVKIKVMAKNFYRSIMSKDFDPEAVNSNVQYLLYRLLGLGYNQDADIDQEEIMQYIRETVYTSNGENENEQKFQQFVLEYSDYLAQLRQNSDKGILDKIEDDIQQNYADNISLKSLSEKYYINSAYLGQIFKKKRGCTFKDYLNNVRVHKAAELLLYSDKKMYEIAIDVGYKNQEYFINKFEEVYGDTPTRFRRKNLHINKVT